MCSRCRSSPSPTLSGLHSHPPSPSLFISLSPLLFSRHFLFKTGTGTTPLFSTATPGYTMATGSVYSPPTRPLPRNTLSRSAFKFKKSSKYCSWRCTALSAVGLSILLSVLLCYCIGRIVLLQCMHLHTHSLCSGYLIQM